MPMRVPFECSFKCKVPTLAPILAAPRACHTIGSRSLYFKHSALLCFGRPKDQRDDTSQTTGLVCRTRSAVPSGLACKAYRKSGERYTSQNRFQTSKKLFSRDGLAGPARIHACLSRHLLPAPLLTAQTLRPSDGDQCVTRACPNQECSHRNSDAEIYAVQK